MVVSITKALEIIDNTTTKLPCEVIPIEDSVGRVVSSSYSAKFSLPRFDNSAMDGYAVKVDDQNSSVRCDKIIYAGSDTNYTLHSGEAIKIMTGAAIPRGCEAIVPIEDVEVNGELIVLPKTITPHAHIRDAGEDIQRSQLYLHKGEVVGAYTLALLASQGVTHISVTRRVRVAIFGTGDELRPHYEHIKEHQLYNSNAPMFLARAKELECDISYIGGSTDSIDSLKECINKALDADIIITSGGVSVGDKDFTKDAFVQLGMDTLFSGVAIKPGKPTTIGKIGDRVIVNLPGNPLAAMVNYEIFVKPIIRRLSGAVASHLDTIEAKMAEDLKIKPGRHSVILGRYDGWFFSALPHQLPGMVSPLGAADGFIIVSPEVSLLKKGEVVKMLPIRYDHYSKKVEDIFTS